MGSEMKDIKNLEKLVKVHDSRMMRNIHQVNGNLLSLFKKTTANTEGMLREIRKISGDLNALFAFIQSTTQISTEPSIYLIPKELHNKLDKLEGLVQAQRQQNSSRLESASNCSINEDLTDHLQKLHQRLSSIEYHINNTLNKFNSENVVRMIFDKYFTNIQDKTKLEDKEVIIDKELKKTIEKIFGKDPALERSNPVNKTRCRPNYRNLIDVRFGATENCDDTQGMKRKNNKKPQGSLIDVRNNLNPAEDSEYEDSDENFESTTPDSVPDQITEEISTETPTTNAYNAT